MQRLALGVVLLVASCARPSTTSPNPTPPPPVGAAPSATAVTKADAGEAECSRETFGLAPGGAETNLARIEAKRHTMGVAKKQLVATSHALATEAGLGILRAGGSAVDAFVAAVLVQDVVLPGVTSTAGLAGVLVYDAKSKRVTYVHGGVGDPIDPARRHRAGDRTPGKLVLVPGAPAAYAELIKRFGKKRLADVVEPAAKLAAGGFPADGLFASGVAGSRARLERSEYGRRTFFSSGKPVAEGDIVKMPEVAKTLRAFGKDPAFFHRGAWAGEAVALANGNGGSLRREDFATYAVDVAPALHGTFMGYDLFAGGHGGLKALASLGALERLRAGQPANAPSASLDDLVRLVRVQNAASTLPALFERDLVARGESVDIGASAETVAELVRKGSTGGQASGGTHSSAAIVVDADGNVVVGTHTIETLNWGEGLFVGGIPLSTSAEIAFDDPAAAKRRMRIDPLTSTIALKDGAPRAALTVYGTGLHPADVQLLDAVLARGLDAEDAVLEPRVGYHQLDLETFALDKTKSVVDPRFTTELLCAARSRGVMLERSMPGLPPGMVDTGFPTLVTITTAGIHGMTPDPGHIHGLAAGD